MKRIESRLDSCVLSEDPDILEVEIALKGREGKGDKVATFRVRPVTDAERAESRRDASTGRQTVSVDKEGTKSVSQELNAELYNTSLLFHALGGKKKFGNEGWSLVDDKGEVRLVTLAAVRDLLHPGIVRVLVDEVVGLSSLSRASEKN